MRIKDVKTLLGLAAAFCLFYAEPGLAQSGKHKTSQKKLDAALKRLADTTGHTRNNRIETKRFLTPPQVNDLYSEIQRYGAVLEPRDGIHLLPGNVNVTQTLYSPKFIAKGTPKKGEMISALVRIRGYTQASENTFNHGSDAELYPTLGSGRQIDSEFFDFKYESSGANLVKLEVKAKVSAGKAGIVVKKPSIVVPLELALAAVTNENGLKRLRNTLTSNAMGNSETEITQVIKTISKLYDLLDDDEDLFPVGGTMYVRFANKGKIQKDGRSGTFEITSDQRVQYFEVLDSGKIGRIVSFDDFLGEKVSPVELKLPLNIKTAILADLKKTNWIQDDILNGIQSIEELFESLSVVDGTKPNKGKNGMGKKFIKCLDDFESISIL